MKGHVVGFRMDAGEVPRLEVAVEWGDFTPVVLVPVDLDLLDAVARRFGHEPDITVELTLELT